MKSFLILFGITILAMFLSFAFIGVKMIFKKNGEFKRGCSSSGSDSQSTCHCGGGATQSKCSEHEKNEALKQMEVLKEVE